MKQRTVISAALMLLLLTFVAIPVTTHSQTAEEIQKIASAMPDKATVAPKKQRNLLVFSLPLGHIHSSIPYFDKAVQAMAEKTGAFSVTVSTDSTVFNSKELKKYDAILFNNTTHLKFSDKKARKALMDFVKGGKGIAGFHAATDNFYVWDEALEMMGGTFWDHPWVSKGTWAIKIDDPDHKLNAAFNGEDFKINDEIYRNKPPYFGHSREKLRVLVSLDMTDDSTRTAKGVRPEDKDLPVAWVRSYGKGRVFYGGFGHNHHILWNPMIMRFYLDALQYVLGDLEVDATPSMAKAFSELEKYDYGKSRVWLTNLSEYVRSVLDSTDAVAVYEEGFIGILKKDVPYAAKDYACRQLSIIGTAASVPALSDLLKTEKTADIARYALERIPDPAAEQALLKALSKSKGNTKVGIISSLGQKKSSDAVKPLGKLVGESDGVVANASIASLANIADSQAMATLAQARKETKGDLHVRITDAYLACADQEVRLGNKSKAESVYREVYTANEPTRLRYAALRGLVLVGANDIETTMAAAINSDDMEMQKVAIGLIREVPGSTIISTSAALLPELSHTAQVQMIAAFADRADKTALPAVTKSAAHDDMTVRLAAMSALGSLGDVATLDLLVDTALNKRGDEQEIARKSLDQLPGKDIDAAVLEAVKSDEGRKKAEYVRAVGARNIAGTTELLLNSARDSDRYVRMEAIRALKIIAQPDDLPALINLLVEVESDAERKEALQSVSAVAHKIPDKGQQAEAALAALPNAKETASRGVLLQLLGSIGSDQALPVLREALQDQETDIRTAAVRGLSEWPNADPAQDLLAVARGGSDEVERVLALRGYIRLTGLPSERSPEKSVKMYRTAIDLADNVNEKRQVLSGLANLQSLAALQMAGEYLDDSTLKAEAEQAVLRIASDGRVRREHSTVALELVAKVEAGTSSEQVKNYARQLIERIENQ